jgi:hypothetical protein
MTAIRKIWVITDRGQVNELSLISTSDCIKWWCYEGDDKWQKGEPPNTSRRLKKDASGKPDAQIRAF